MEEQVQQRLEGRISVDSKRSSFPFAPFWVDWKEEGVYGSLTEAKKAMQIKYSDNLGRANPIRKSYTKKDGTVRETVEIMPEWGSHEVTEFRDQFGLKSTRRNWDLYNEGKFLKDYVHLRFRRFL